MVGASISGGKLRASARRLREAFPDFSPPLYLSFLNVPRIFSCTGSKIVVFRGRNSASGRRKSMPAAATRPKSANSAASSKPGRPPKVQAPKSTLSSTVAGMDVAVLNAQQELQDACAMLDSTWESLIPRAPEQSFSFAWLRRRRRGWCIVSGASNLGLVSPLRSAGYYLPKKGPPARTDSDSFPGGRGGGCATLRPCNSTVRKRIPWEYQDSLSSLSL